VSCRAPSTTRSTDPSSGYEPATNASTSSRSSTPQRRGGSPAAGLDDQRPGQVPPALGAPPAPDVAIVGAPFRFDHRGDDEPGGGHLGDVITERAVELRVRATGGTLRVGGAIEVGAIRGEAGGIVRERPPERMRRRERPPPARPQHPMHFAVDLLGILDEWDRAERRE